MQSCKEFADCDRPRRVRDMESGGYSMLLKLDLCLMQFGRTLADECGTYARRARLVVATGAWAARHRVRTVRRVGLAGIGDERSACPKQTDER
jgi:hypothetical protein